MIVSEIRIFTGIDITLHPEVSRQERFVWALLELEWEKRSTFYFPNSLFPFLNNCNRTHTAIKGDPLFLWANDAKEGWEPKKEASLKHVRQKKTNEDVIFLRYSLSIGLASLVFRLQALASRVFFTYASIAQSDADRSWLRDSVLPLVV